MPVSLQYTMAGIYIHIPFCKQACHYCDFHFSTNLNVKDDLISCILKEIELQKDYLTDHTVETIYLGGGTPSILPTVDVGNILTKIHHVFAVSPLAEITIECNPDDLSEQKLAGLYSLGVNRLSIGVQSFDDPVLKFLNRVHTGISAEGSIHLAREAGFKNISVDLIYAIPGMTPSDWEQNITKVLALNPEHISAYALTIEERTVFGNWAAKGKLTLVEDDTAAWQFEMLVDMLEGRGYEHYEVSNFALLNYHSRHNSSYWNQTTYLGIGPSAHSYNAQTRQHNVSNNHKYIGALKLGNIPAIIETLSMADNINDYILTTLRTSWGTNLSLLKDRFNYDLRFLMHDYLENVIKLDLAYINEDILLLTKKGRLLADKISQDLFVTNADQL